MRIRPFVASIAMLAIMGGFIRWAGGNWLHVIAVLGAIMLFIFALIRMYEGMYDDDRD